MCARHGSRKNIVSQNFLGRGTHCSVVCACTVSKMTVKTGLAKAEPAEPLTTGHEYYKQVEDCASV